MSKGSSGGKRSGGGGTINETSNNVLKTLDTKEQIKLSNGDVITKIMSNTYLLDNSNNKDAIILKKGELKKVLNGYYELLKNSGNDTPIEKLIKQNKAKIESSIPKKALKKNININNGKYQRSEVNLNKAFKTFNTSKGFEDKTNNTHIFKIEKDLYFVKHPDVLSSESLYNTKDLKSFIRRNENDFKDSFPHKKAS